MRGAGRLFFLGEGSKEQNVFRQRSERAVLLDDKERTRTALPPSASQFGQTGPWVRTAPQVLRTRQERARRQIKMSVDFLASGTADGGKRGRNGH